MDDKALREEVLRRETVYPGKIIRVEQWQVRLPNGETAQREIVCHIGAAAVIALDQQGQVVLVRQHRVAIDQVARWKPPPASWIPPPRTPLSARSGSSPKRRV